MDSSYFMCVDSDLPYILFDIAMVGADDVAGQERNLPRSIILATFDRFALHSLSSAVSAARSIPLFVHVAARATLPPQQKSIPYFSKT